MSAAMLCLAIAIAASGVAFTGIAPGAAPAARIIFWAAVAAVVVCLSLAIAMGVRRRRAAASQPNGR